MGVLKFKSAWDCPDRDKHSDAHIGRHSYLVWMEWAAKMNRTHSQKRCPTCGYWAIWELRTARSRDAE